MRGYLWGAILDFIGAGEWAGADFIGSENALVLQLRFVSFSMTDGGFSLMITSPS